MTERLSTCTRTHTHTHTHTHTRYENKQLLKRPFILMLFGKSEKMFSNICYIQLLLPTLSVQATTGNFQSESVLIADPEKRVLCEAQPSPSHPEKQGLESPPMQTRKRTHGEAEGCLSRSCLATKTPERASWFPPASHGTQPASPTPTLHQKLKGKSGECYSPGSLFPSVLLPSHLRKLDNRQSLPAMWNSAPDFQRTRGTGPGLLTSTSNTSMESSSSCTRSCVLIVGRAAPVGGPNPGSKVLTPTGVAVPRRAPGVCRTLYVPSSSPIPQQLRGRSVLKQTKKNPIIFSLSILKQHKKITG